MLMSLGFASALVRGAWRAPLLVLVVACGDILGDAQPVADSASPANGALRIELQNIAFTACLCHHGFAAGIDGAATVHVVNSGFSPVTLVPGAFVLRNQTTGTAYTTLEGGHADSSSYYTLENVPGTAANPPTPPSFQPTVAPGGSTDISVSFYIDGVKWPVTPSLYQLRIDFGDGATATSAAFALAEAS
jgi:hypothetical protein